MRHLCAFDRRARFRPSKPGMPVRVRQGAWGSQKVGTSAGFQLQRLGGSIPPDPVHRLPAPWCSGLHTSLSRKRYGVSTRWRRSSCPVGLTVGRLALNQEIQVRILAGQCSDSGFLGCRPTGRPQGFGPRDAGSNPAVPVEKELLNRPGKRATRACGVRATSDLARIGTAGANPATRSW